MADKQEMDAKLTEDCCAFVETCTDDARSFMVALATIQDGVHGIPVEFLQILLEAYGASVLYRYITRTKEPADSKALINDFFKKVGEVGGNHGN